MLIWVLIFNLVIYFMMTQYWHTYLDAQSDMLNVKYNFSTSYKSYISILVWLMFTFLFLPFCYYIYFNVLHESILLFGLLIWLFWIFWDLYPICMTDNGYKFNNLYINYFDSTYAGPFWVSVSLYIFYKFYKIINQSNIIISVMILLNIFMMSMFFYNWFIYNREQTSNNWLVKLGDQLKWNEYVKYIYITL